MKRILTFCIVLILLVGLVPTAAQTPEEFSISKEALLSALYEADIATMREAIDLKLISCEELTAYYLDRIQSYNKPFNCFITMCDDAIDVARQRDQTLAEGNASGLLFGIPIVIKDNINLAGYHTTNGQKKNDSQIASSNATIVDYLLAEGAVIIAKANMSTDAQSALDSISKAVGETKNAYSIYMSAAGSSGGSAVATSLNFAAAGIGTDTNSSLRLPAAFAGCVSLRATHGLISNNGIIKLNSSRDIAGAITRTVYDQAIMLDVLTAGAYNYTKNLNANALQGVRIGVLKELSTPVNRNNRREDDWDPEIVAAFAAVVENLKQSGAEVVEVSMSNIFTLSDATLANNNASTKEALYKAFTNMLTKYDVSAVIFPSYITSPLRSGTDADGKYWNVWDQPFAANCTTLSPSASLPEITVPMGVHSLGCGMAFEIAAAKGEEQLLLDLAYTYTLQHDSRVIPQNAPDAYAEYHAGSLQDIITAYKQSTLPPETSIPETSVPETSMPETSMPETSVPGTSVPESSIPETSVPETSVPSTTVPEATVPIPTEPEPTEPAPTEPTSTAPAPTEPEPVVPSTTVPSTSQPVSTIPSTSATESTTPPPTEPTLSWLLPATAAVLIMLFLVIRLIKVVTYKPKHRR